MDIKINEMLENAEVVYERHHDYDPTVGPYGSDKVGFKIGDRVWWVGISGSHGGPDTFSEGEELCKEIVNRIKSTTKQSD